MINDNAVQSYLRYAPDSHLVFASFASAFLLKLLRHKFVHLLPEERRSKIIPLVERLVRVLNSTSVAIDDSHTPKIYARFLAGLLHKHRTLASAQRMEQQRDKDTDMKVNVNTNNQERQAPGLSIDTNTLHQQNNLPSGPFSPPSPHPSIRVTPPPADDHNLGYMMHNPSDAHADMEMLGQGSLEFSGASGSGTVHPMDEIARYEEDDDIPPSLEAINDPFWQHGFVPWLDASVPFNWDKEFPDPHRVPGLDG